ncbi:MAG: site-specific integrase [Alphaproteobacteria bacterium]|nr:MAG: site-specific integrase [Alphaproteobacteria bacterium]
MLDEGSPVPVSVVRARVTTDASGARTQLPVVITPDGVLEPLLEYFLARSHDRSLSWMKKVAHAVLLFLEYLFRNPDERSNYRLFLNFSQRLYTGTCDVASGNDPSGLGWRPMNSKSAKRIVSALNDFFDFLGLNRPVALSFNPKWAGSSYDRMIDEVAFQYRRDRAFLGHTWATSAEVAGIQGRAIRPKKEVKVETSRPPTFPEEHFEKLLTEGFRVGERVDYRGILITMLLHCAGFRESEPFHLFTSDVMPDPSNTASALVLIHHPSQGAAPSTWNASVGSKKQFKNRRDYLQQAWNLNPRNEVMGPRHAGWKGGAHEIEFESLYYRAYWFSSWWGEFFLSIWYRYLEELALMTREHPFAFVNTARDPLGEMYSIDQFSKAHARAVQRIGLEVSKKNGTTPHGHRYAYGQRLVKAGVPRESIRRFMHHGSLESQEPYTAPSLADSFRELSEAETRLQQLNEFGRRKLMGLV